MKLSLPERWMVSNQLRILEELYPKEAEDLAVQREAIERGYERVYNINSPINTDTMDEGECLEVWDTLDMFRAIDTSIRELKTDDFETHPQRKFSGYDGNNESKFMAFTSYTIERLERWTELLPENPGYFNSFNSHIPMQPIYQNMIRTWKKIPPNKRFSMNLEQLTEVLDSATIPDTR